MFKKRNGILHKNRGKGFEKSHVPLHGTKGGGQIFFINIVLYLLKIYFLDEEHESSIYVKLSLRIYLEIYVF